jgi:endonuclease/exonuclease/phosphatase family metal-dependent hydrolase
MILSRHPVVESWDFVMPGTWNRRIVAGATVELPNGAEVDVYCNHLTPAFDSMAFPYTGQYGEGNIDQSGWAAEQRLQATRLAEQVEAETGEGVALILGDFNTGRAAAEGILPEAVETMDVLEAAFTPAVASGYEPVCTHCPDNANTLGLADPVWIDHIFMTGLDPAAVRSTERTFVEPVVPVEGDPSSVPLSDHYGLRSVLDVEP